MVNAHIHAEKPVITVCPNILQQKEKQVGNKVLVFVIHRGIV
jgi:hypothetical protein